MCFVLPNKESSSRTPHVNRDPNRTSRFHQKINITESILCSPKQLRQTASSWSTHSHSHTHISHFPHCRCCCVSFAIFHVLCYFHFSPFPLPPRTLKRRMAGRCQLGDVTPRCDRCGGALPAEINPADGGPRWPGAGAGNTVHLVRHPTAPGSVQLW